MKEIISKRVYGSVGLPDGCCQKRIKKFMLPKGSNDCQIETDAFCRKDGCLLYPLLKGSLTFEAAFVLPLMVFAVVAFYTLFAGMVFELKMQQALAKVGNELAVSAYLAEEAAGSEAGSVVLGFVSGPYVYTKVEGELKQQIAGSGFLKGEISGLSFLGSCYDPLSSDLVLRCSYRLHLPFADLFGEGIQITQTIRQRVFTGVELETADEDEEEYVYITPNGSVYHTHLCSYLHVSVRAVSYAQVGLLRNASGGKYYACSNCGGQAGDTVYIATYGDRYHTDPDCSQIKRNIQRVPISEVGGRPLCSKCGRMD